MRFASRSTLQACADNERVEDSDLQDSQQVESSQEIEDTQDVESSQQIHDSQNTESTLDVSSWVRIIPGLVLKYYNSV